MKKILVIGIKGMAGHVIFNSLPKLGNYEVYGVARNVSSNNRIFNLEIIGINREVITKKVFYEGNELTIKF